MHTELLNTVNSVHHHPVLWKGVFHSQCSLELKVSCTGDLYNFMRYELFDDVRSVVQGPFCLPWCDDITRLTVCSSHHKLQVDIRGECLRRRTRDFNFQSRVGVLVPVDPVWKQLEVDVEVQFCRSGPCRNLDLFLKAVVLVVEKGVNKFTSFYFPRNCHWLI